MKRAKERTKSIAIVTGDFLAPTETWILRHANGLQHYRPIVIAKRKTGQKNVRFPRVFVLKAFSFVIQPLNLLGRAFLKKRFFGYELIIKLILSVFKVRSVHVHFLWTGIWFFDYMPNLDMPVFITAHGSDVNRAVSDPLYREKVQRVFSRADKIICVSQFIKKRVISLGCDERKLIVNPVGTPVINTEETGLKKREKITLICVAAFREEKGHAYLLEAMAQVIKEVKDIQLVLVGDGELRHKIVNLIDVLGLEKHVHLLGWKGEEEVFELLSDADIYVQHSVKCLVDDKILKEEALSVSLVEAAGMGLPLVATAVGGIPEICVHGRNGMLCDEKDTSCMASHILTLIKDPELRLSLGRAGRDLVLKKFDASKLLKNLESLYQEY